MLHCGKEENIKVKTGKERIDRFLTIRQQNTEHNYYNQ